MNNKKMCRISGADVECEVPGPTCQRDSSCIVRNDDVYYLIANSKVTLARKFSVIMTVIMEFAAVE